MEKERQPGTRGTRGPRFWPYGPWYSAGGWMMTGAAIDAATGYALLTVAAEAVTGLAILAFTAAVHASWRQSPEAPLRATLEALVRERAGTGAWLNREADVVFMPEVQGPRWMPRIWTLHRADVEQGVEVMEHGRAPVTMDVFRFTAPFSGVMRDINGAMITMADDIDHGANPGRWHRYAGLVRAMRDGSRYARAPELAEVLGQFRDAELIGYPPAGA